MISAFSASTLRTLRPAVFLGRKVRKVDAENAKLNRITAGRRERPKDSFGDNGHSVGILRLVS